MRPPVRRRWRTATGRRAGGWSWSRRCTEGGQPTGPRRPRGVYGTRPSYPTLGTRSAIRVTAEGWGTRYDDDVRLSVQTSKGHDIETRVPIPASAGVTARSWT